MSLARPSLLRAENIPRKPERQELGGKRSGIAARSRSVSVWPGSAAQAVRRERGIGLSARRARTTRTNRATFAYRNTAPQRGDLGQLQFGEVAERLKASVPKTEAAPCRREFESHPLLSGGRWNGLEPQLSLHCGHGASACAETGALSPPDLPHDDDHSPPDVYPLAVAGEANQQPESHGFLPLRARGRRAASAAVRVQAAARWSAAHSRDEQDRSPARVSLRLLGSQRRSRLTQTRS